MIIDNLILQGIKSLKNNKILNSKLDAELLLSSVIKKDRLFFALNGKNKINKKDSLKYLKLVDRRKKNEPIAYILKKKEFWRSSFFVNKDVLIPRPDTEVLLEDIRKRFKYKSQLNILDIGTGSGCILLSILKEFANFKGTGIDRSQKAINIAKYNSISLKNCERVKFIHSNIDNYKFGNYDIVVSNPPYIKSYKIKYLSEDIKRYEPRIALDGGITGLNIIKKIIKKAKKILKLGGYLYLEIAEDQLINVKNILLLSNFRIVKVLIDYGNNTRCIISTNLK
jgi:release factor glutamine methyltransferase|tara:strand:+ start:6925 stop:7770 length:846 start_codon:yes stop_codon:yes gene_type:complete